MLVTIEGPDGAGKSTIAPLVAANLSHVRAVYWAKKGLPGGPDFVRQRMSNLRGALWPGGNLQDAQVLPRRYWLFLQAAWYGLSSVFAIDPMLAAGKVVIVDGWYYKCMAKASMEGIDPALLEQIFADSAEPDLVIHCDIDLDAVYDRNAQFNCGELGGFHDYSALGRDSYTDHQSKLALHLLRFVPEHKLATIRLEREAGPVENAMAVTRLLSARILGEGILMQRGPK